MGRQLGQRIGPQRTHRPTPLGDALDEARNAKSWTQRELAEKSRVSLRTIKAIESGTAGRAGHRVIAKLNNATGVRLWERADEIAAERARAEKRGRRQKVQRGS